MNQSVFLEQIRKGGIPLITRFLGITPQEAVKLMQHNQLEDHLDETYAQMPDDELTKFQNEIVYRNSPSQTTTRPTAPTPGEWNNGEPFWAEIISDHHDETDGFIVAYVDAYKTEDSDEGGVVIANVVGAVIDGQIRTTVLHHLPEAQVDPTAKAVIEETVADVTEALKETASQAIQIRRIRKQRGAFCIYEFYGWKQGAADGELLADITFVDQRANDYMNHPTPPGFDPNRKPAVNYRDDLDADVRAQVEKDIQATLDEIEASPKA